MYLDYAENQAARQIPMKMTEWVKKLDAFLRFNEREILQDNGSIAHEVALALAERVYEEYRAAEDKKYISDFDRVVKKLLKPPSSSPRKRGSSART